MGLTKYCPRCEKDLPVDEFYKNAGYCKPCSHSAVQDWKAQNPKRATYLHKRSNYKRYGTTPEEVAERSSVCEICGTDQDLCVDHEHTSGEFRGVLCRRHNSAIGFLNDDPNLIQAALSYLRKHEYSC